MPSYPLVRLPTLDLFSGIGGFSVALRSICSTVAYCEKDAFCKQVLERNMSRGGLDRAPIYDDVCRLTAARLKADRVTPPVVITAGFPCQDISIAGTYRGLRGDRSSLFHHIPRLIRSLPSVRHVVLENSPLVTGEILATIVRELMAAGMTRLAFGYYNASDVGALHRRRRWVCFATRAKAAAQLPRQVPAAASTWDWARADARFSRFLVRDPRRYRGVIRRCQSLGNAVVPQFIAHAVGALLSALRAPPPPEHTDTFSIVKDTRHLKRAGDTFVCDTGGVVTRASTSFTMLPQHRVHLRIIDAHGAAHERDRWPSPIYSSRHWYPTTLNHPRMLDMFVGVALHEQNRPPPAPAKEVMINPRFVEHLMGYPPDWTAV